MEEENEGSQQPAEVINEHLSNQKCNCAQCHKLINDPAAMKIIRYEQSIKTTNHHTEEINLIGHNGPVYAVSISYDGQLLLSASHDTTIRLWSIPLRKTTDTMSSLVVYKGHIKPVWDVKFSPFGYYFATGSADTTAQLWVTSQVTSIRLFRGHFNDVDVVSFHPNLHYLATGSSDRTIRMWTIEDGTCVRVISKHTLLTHTHLIHL
jgi:WD40 repeat protein